MGLKAPDEGSFSMLHVASHSAFCRRSPRPAGCGPSSEGHQMVGLHAPDFHSQTVRRIAPCFSQPDAVWQCKSPSTLTVKGHHAILVQMSGLHLLACILHESCATVSLHIRLQKLWVKCFSLLCQLTAHGQPTATKLMHEDIGHQRQTQALHLA